VTVLGPAPQPLARLRDRHRWHVLLKSADGKPVRTLAASLLDWADEHIKGSVRVMADVDPIEVL
jgi:primosomal protein N' (replication factor Y)